MKAIVAADRNWGIGYQNRLLVSIPSDMKFFRQTTTGHVVVMGRKTLESFPNGLPLKNRTNIVLTANKDYAVKDAIIVHSEKELLEELKKYDTDEIYVIGGESVYRMMLPYLDTIYVTKIDHAFQADTFFPNLDELEDWEMTEEGDEQTCFDLEFAFTRYERRKPRCLPGENRKAANKMQRKADRLKSVREHISFSTAAAPLCGKRRRSASGCKRRKSRARTLKNKPAGANIRTARLRR